MHKIDTENRTSNDEFADADASQGIAGTDLNASWFNTVQRELCNAVTGSGQTLNASDDKQLLKALKSIKGVNVVAEPNSTYTLNKTGNTVFLFEAKSFAIKGSFDDGAFVIFVPVWNASSAAQIEITYNGETEMIKKGCCCFGLVMNDPDERQMVLYPFMGTDNYGYTYTNGLIDNGVIGDSAAVGPNDEYRPWQLYKNWTNGQVKRVRSMVTTKTSYKINYYSDTTGTLGVLEFYQNSYRELMCVGSYTREDGLVYAVLVPNGPTVLPTTSED